MASASLNKLLPRLRRAFLDHGYDQITMVGLAKACDLTRRALYHHFSNKEEVFRAIIAWNHEREIAAGFEAGDRILAEGGSAVDVLTGIFDVRYGDTRRQLGLSPHQQELNTAAFLRCRDIMITSAVVFQDRLAGLLEVLDRHGLLHLRRDMCAADIAQLLADGARGVNQSLPPRPPDSLPERYRAMCAALLYGCCAASGPP